MTTETLKIIALSISMAFPMLGDSIVSRAIFVWSGIISVMLWFHFMKKNDGKKFWIGFVLVQILVCCVLVVIEDKYLS